MDVKKRPISRPLVYTLSNNTLFNICVNPDVKIDVKIKANTQECVTSKGRSKSARMAPFCRLQQKHTCCNVTRQCAMALIRRNGMAMEWRSAMVSLRTYTPVFCVLVLSGPWPIAYFVCYSFTSGSFVCSFRYTSLTLYSSLSIVCVLLLLLLLLYTCNYFELQTIITVNSKQLCTISRTY